MAVGIAVTIRYALESVGSRFCLVGVVAASFVSLIIFAKIGGLSCTRASIEFGPAERLIIFALAIFIVTATNDIFLI